MLLAIDLDGTLIDSAPDIAHCLGVAMQATGRPAPGEALTRDLIGDGIETLLERALGELSPVTATAPESSGEPAAGGVPPHDFRVALDTFSHCYRENLYVRSRLYPAVPVILDHYLHHGMKLCCITNKRIRYAEDILQQAGIRDRFELVIGGDSLAEKKPSPMPLLSAAASLGIPCDRAIMIGDSHHDLHAARAAGYAGFIWARYGYCPAIDEGEGDAISIMQRFADLPVALDDLLAQI
jgi:phosphoglycolate phosphatase